MLNQPFATPSSVPYSRLWESYANGCRTRLELYSPTPVSHPDTETTITHKPVPSSPRPLRFRRWGWASIVRLLMALGVLYGLGLLSARPAAAAQDVDVRHEPLVNPPSDWSQCPGVMSNAPVSKAVSRASLYVVLGQ